MSSGGGGGFYRYPCKYRLTHNCPNWVYVNNSPCANCCAEGRDDEMQQNPAMPWPSSRDIFVPRAENGMLYYTLMEMVNTGETGRDWSIGYKINQQPIRTVTATTTTAVTTSAIPGPPVMSTSF